MDAVHVADHEMDSSALSDSQKLVMFSTMASLHEALEIVESFNMNQLHLSPANILDRRFFRDLIPSPLDRKNQVGIEKFLTLFLMLFSCNLNAMFTQL